YRLHQARLRGEKKGVSPVVATLILILIAVAAAAFLYLWLVVWQGNITGGIGQPKAQSTLSVGGSTSAYPFASEAATWFEQNQSDVQISVNQGGTGAGMLAVCAGAIDIGTASTPETPSGLIASDGCPSSDLNTIQITTVAYDAVDVIVPVANDHGLISASYDTLALIYGRATVGVSPILVPTTIDTTAISGIAGYPAGALLWENIPAATLGATVGAAKETVDTGGYSTTNVATQFGSLAGYPNLIYDASGIAGTPCGFNICAGGTAVGSGAGQTGAAIVTVGRSDAAGATQTFESRILGAASASTFATSFASLGFSGCGSSNLLSDCGFAPVKSGVGDTGVISAVATTPDAIGYASDGLARSSTSGVTCQGVATAACGIAIAAPGTWTNSPTDTIQAAVAPSLGSTGSIAGGIINGGFGPSGATTTLTVAQSYDGARAFEFVSLQPYTGVAQEFVTFILDPANNIALASASHEVSVYSV
ncbi:MAG TPA: substrate-binding domain-containing protein, partial [Thermoplasmata archaeon]|nr:substrate-binding domain-containing protein [Thermoplasmata archaeon]